MTLAAILPGLINIGIVIAVLVLVGAVIQPVAAALLARERQNKIGQ